LLIVAVIPEAVQVALSLQARQEWLHGCQLPKLDVSCNDKFSGVSLEAAVEIAKELRLPRGVRANHENKARAVKPAEFRQFDVL
jgi:hypothetical protein